MILGSASRAFSLRTGVHVLSKTMVLAASALVLFIGPVSSAFAAENKPLNVLFIAVDDLKPMLGCYGDTQVHSPNIDRLAARGTVFLNAQCQQAVCAPSRASLLTGFRPDTTKVWDLKTRFRAALPNVVTLPQYFKQEGYESVGTGKIYDPRSAGGREKMDAISWSRPYIHPENLADETYGYRDPAFIKIIEEAKLKIKGNKGLGYENFLKVVGKRPTDKADVSDEAYYDGAMAANSVQLIKELSQGDKPFFLAVGFKKPHLPFNAPQKYWDMYDPQQFRLAEFRDMPEGSPEFHYQPGWELRNYKVPKKGPLPDDLQRELIHGYYSCVSYIDTQVGKLLDALDDAGVADNTVIVLWGDHGWHLGDHGIWCKHTNYEQAARSPLIFVSPQAGEKNNKSTSPVEFVDIYPTLCDLAGLPIPDGLHGVSLQPVMEDPSVIVKPTAVSQYHRRADGKHVMGYSHRDQRYRYIEWIEMDYHGGETSGPVVAKELYDYEKDPTETKSLVDDPAYAKVLSRMEKLAHAYHVKYTINTKSKPSAKLQKQSSKIQNRKGRKFSQVSRISATKPVACEVAATPSTPFDKSLLENREPDAMVTYKNTPQGELSLHIFHPPGWKETDHRSAVVFFHGGGWKQGKAEALYRQSQYLAECGMVAISAEYRISSKHKTTPLECVLDGNSAIRYVRANAAKLGIDPDRIAAGGGSAGGHVAASTAVLEGFSDPQDSHAEVSSRPNALVLFNPILDTTKTGFGHRRVGDNPERLSPVHQLKPGIPPTIIFNGDHDKAATIDRARVFSQEMAKHDCHCELVVYPGEEHSFFGIGKKDGIYFGDTIRRTETFLHSLGYIE